MNFDEYKESRQRSISAGVHERWQTRVVAQRMTGANGARTYLGLYGKGIKPPKVIELALKAGQEGDAEMSDFFWRTAYRMETGEEASATSPTKMEAPKPRPKPQTSFPFRPGELATMQPTDATNDRQWYVRNPAYWGQPKIYGHRLVVFATEDEVLYQARSLLLQEPPSAEIDVALREAARVWGPFVLDGERYFTDCTGKERMTGAQAATVNVQNGQPDRPIPAQYAVFRCLAHNGADLRPLRDEVRLDLARQIVDWLKDQGYDHLFAFLEPARDAGEKQALIDRQTREGREGEVWFLHGAPYLSGKSNKHLGQLITVRTKYRNTLDVFVTALDPTTVEGRAFAAMRVAVFCAGRQVNLGRVGTGFTWADTFRIRQAFERDGRLVVEITTQGFTENRAVVHGSYVCMRPDKLPVDCTIEPDAF